MTVFFQVFGIADERLGEELVAWIKEIPGSNLNSQDIKQFCKGKVTMFMNYVIYRLGNCYRKKTFGKT